MSRLGYERFGAQGGDWGSAVTSTVGEMHPDRVVGIHVNMPTVPLGPLTDDATEQRAHELRRLRVAHAVGHRLPDPAVDPAPDARLRPGRLAGRAAGVDRREVLGVDRLRRRPAQHLHARPAARQRDRVLVHRNRRVVGPPLLGERGPAPPRRPRGDGRAASVPSPCRPAARSSRARSVDRHGAGRSSGSRTSTGGTSRRRAATSPRSSSRHCSSTRCGRRSVRCAEVLDTASRRSGGRPVDEGAFEGVRVVELAQWVFVPVAGALLADWGADVIRIERPEGDPYRGLDDPGHRHRQRRRQPVDRAGQPRQALGRARPAHARRDARSCTSCSRPPTCSSPTSGPARSQRLGLDAETLTERYPSLVYARGHGYGVRGPDADRPGYDASAFWARGGHGARAHPAGARPADRSARRDGRPQRRDGAGVRDGGRAARSARGPGKRLGGRRVAARDRDVDAVVRRAVRAAGRSSPRCRWRGERRTSTRWSARTGRRTVATSSWCSSRPTATGPILPPASGATTDRRSALRRPRRRGGSTPRSASPCSRRVRRPHLRGVEGAARRHRRAVGAGAGGRGAARRPAGRSPTTTSARSSIDGGPAYRLPTVPVQFDERPPALRRAPEHGEHTEMVLLELGYSWDSIGELQDAGVIP